MPSDFDDFSERASHNYQGSGSGDLHTRAQEDKALEARDFLRACMESAGFFAYEAEWWHYTDPDKKKSPLLNLSLSQLAAADGVSHV
jgi:D-alanyl-D-alanine dipeptidase